MLRQWTLSVPVTIRRRSAGTVLRNKHVNGSPRSFGTGLSSRQYTHAPVEPKGCISSTHRSKPLVELQRKSLNNTMFLKAPVAWYVTQSHVTTTRFHHLNTISVRHASSKSKTDDKIATSGARSSSSVATTKQSNKVPSTTSESSRAAEIWKTVKDAAKHTWHSLKLLANNTRITIGLVRKMSHNHPLTRREQRLLYMTTSDLMRMVPFSLFIIIPGAEVLLPIALKLYPGLLPSTFTTSEDEVKKTISNFPVTIGYRKQIRDHLMQVANANGLGEDPLLQSYLSGEPITPQKIRVLAAKIAHHFNVEKLPRSVVIASCQSFGLGTRFPIAPFVPVSMPTGYLREKLNRHLESIRRDDIMILREGLDKLSLEELKADNRERCMQEHTTEANLRKQLRHWTKLTLGNHFANELNEIAKSEGDLAGTTPLPSSRPIGRSKVDIGDWALAKAAKAGSYRGTIDPSVKGPIDPSFLIFVQPRADHFMNSIYNMPQYVVDTYMKAKDTPPEVIKQLNLVVSMSTKEVNEVMDRMENKPELSQVQLKLGRLLVHAKAQGVPIKRAFALFDIDRDGRLSRDEIAECLQELNIPVTTKELSVLFKEYDTDHDGKISLGEFLKVSKDASILEQKLDQALAGDSGTKLSEDAVAAAVAAEQAAFLIGTAVRKQEAQDAATKKELEQKQKKQVEEVKDEPTDDRDESDDEDGELKNRLAVILEEEKLMHEEDREEQEQIVAKKKADAEKKAADAAAKKAEQQVEEQEKEIRKVLGMEEQSENDTKKEK